MSDIESGIAYAPGAGASTNAGQAAGPVQPGAGRAPAGLLAGVVGNSRIAALVDERGVVSWMCVPRFDGDPVFCSLLDDGSSEGCFAIEMENVATISQQYLRNTAILCTTMTDAAGQRIEVIDFCPRFYHYGRLYAPVTLVRMVRRVSGRPRLRVAFAPRCNYGADRPATTFGSHHIRAQVPAYPLRLTTDAPITQLMERAWIRVNEDLTLILGPDETLTGSPRETGRRLFDETRGYWSRWVRNLAIPFEWQDAVIRAAITLKLNTFDDTGAIVASLTTSIPEAPGTQRNWDYRFCWLRDAYFTVDALNRLGATGSMQRFLRYLEDIVTDAADGALQPVYGISGATQLDEAVAPALRGYRGHGPVRIGNLAWLQAQNDVYGSAILAVAHAFYDRRLARPAGRELFDALERFGDQAWLNHARPDASIWEYRGREAVHTFSSVMCWAACDRLARIASHLGLADRRDWWRDRAAQIRATIEARAWNADIGAFASTFGGRDPDASLLLLGPLGFLKPDDPRLRSTVSTIERELRRGDFLLRYAQPDDFGMPETAFLVCTFWWIQALAQIGERDRARELFENVLAQRNALGLLSEDIDPVTHALWGNYPQTYSMVGIIICAMRLSERWEDAF